MNIRQNVRSHTRITHDKFRRNKIHNGQLAAILNVFLSLSQKSSIIAEGYYKIKCSVLHKDNTRQYMQIYNPKWQIAKHFGLILLIISEFLHDS